jgi:hypothetical protein
MTGRSWNLSQEQGKGWKAFGIMRSREVWKVQHLLKPPDQFLSLPLQEPRTSRTWKFFLRLPLSSPPSTLPNNSPPEALNGLEGKNSRGDVNIKG